VSGEGVTVRVAAIWRDRTATVSATPPEVAMTTPLPVASDVTLPPTAETTAGVVVLHVIVGFVSATLFASVTTAVKVTTSPIALIVSASGVSTIRVAVCVTVIVAVSALPEADTTMRAEPTARALTIPV
jgi:hypothetical protein